MVLIGTLAILRSCETDLQNVCNNEITAAENTTLQGCLAPANQFNREFTDCVNAKKSTAETCTCINTIDTANFDKLRACDTTNKTDEVKANKNGCITGMNILGFIYEIVDLGLRKCKTAQIDSVDGVASCKKVNTVGGAQNKTQAARLLNILRP